MRFWLLILAGVLWSAAARTEVLYTWTMPIEGGLQSFRAVVTDEICPEMTVDGTPRQMRRRAGPTEAFPNSVCVYESDRRVHMAVLDERVFPLSPNDPQRILLVGDTGCRLRQNRPIQYCMLGQDWPFAEVAASLAGVEADLAIHLGDYHYREMACPDPELCGSVHGTNWATWEADFFAPAQPMLSAHPFVFVRGDHEKCGRAWLGYLRYLSAAPMERPLLCDNYYPPYVLSFEDLQIAVLDSSTRDRADYTWDRFRAMRDQVLAVLLWLDREAWVLTHAPLWGYGNRAMDRNAMGTLETLQREAFADMLPRLVSAVIAGDLHFGQVVSTADDPIQITVGNGGSALYATPRGFHEDLEVGYGVAGALFGYQGFGYGLIERGKPGTPITFFDQSGAAQVRCLAAEGAQSCKSEAD